ncbi:hypothetical protein C8F01DRAFT_1247074 [Mycena amicta]|nr:hypothetical protein C8F01DRAFT_1247074 [Mycena amicta]
MDIRIILNPSAVGSPKTNSPLKRLPSSTTPGTPTTASGSSTHRRASLRKSASVGRLASPAHKLAHVHATGTIPILRRHSSLRQTTPLVRQSGPGKQHRVLGTTTATPPPRTRTSTKSGHRRSTQKNGRIAVVSRGSSTASSSSTSSRGVTSSGRDRERDRERAMKLLTRAREHVAAEQQQQLALGGGQVRRTSSIMDVVLDLKGPVVDLEDVRLIIEERLQATNYDFFGDNDAYWAGQATLWFGVDDESATDADDTRFPVSMERSTVSLA